MRKINDLISRFEEKIEKIEKNFKKIENLYIKAVIRPLAVDSRAKMWYNKSNRGGMPRFIFPFLFCRYIISLFRYKIKAFIKESKRAVIKYGP